MTMIHVDDDLTRHGEQDWRGQFAASDRQALQRMLDDRFLAKLRDAVAARKAAGEPGSADPIGDDQTQRHSAWGSIDECAAEGIERHYRWVRGVLWAAGSLLLLGLLLWVYP